MIDRKKIEIAIISETDILALAEAVRAYNKADEEYHAMTAVEGTDEYTEKWANWVACSEFLIIAARNCVTILGEKEDCMVAYCGNLSKTLEGEGSVYLSNTAKRELDSKG